GPSRSSVILAHDSQISQLTLDKTGSLLATSSDKLMSRPSAARATHRMANGLDSRLASKDDFLSLVIAQTRAEVTQCPSRREMKLKSHNQPAGYQLGRVPVKAWWGCAPLIKKHAGTLIRIHDTETGHLLQELRRGVDRADICSIVFHPTGRWVVVSSDKGTVHVFAVRVPAGGGRESRGAGGNARSKFRFFGGYFGSEWSFARFRVPDYRCIACFGSTTNTVAVMCADGSYYKAKFDPVFG
ncbi:WD repeat domain phosphoinositide-interacting protein 3, partial [Perkinsus olseni]